MWSVSEVICLLILVVSAIWDIRTRKVSSWILVVSAAGSILYHIVKGDVDVWVTLAGLVVGMLFLIISKVTDEGIGYGDSMVIILLGFFLGVWNLLIVLSVSFFLLLCVSIPLLWRKKMSRKCTLPFLPFLAGGYLCFLLMGGMPG